MLLLLPHSTCLPDGGASLSGFLSCMIGVKARSVYTKCTLWHTARHRPPGTYGSTQASRGIWLNTGLRGIELETGGVFVTPFVDDFAPPWLLMFGCHATMPSPISPAPVFVFFKDMLLHKLRIWIGPPSHNQRSWALQHQPTTMHACMCMLTHAGCERKDARPRPVG